MLLVINVIRQINRMNFGPYSEMFRRLVESPSRFPNVRAPFEQVSGLQSTQGSHHQEQLIEREWMYPDNWYQSIDNELGYFPVVHLELAAIRIDCNIDAPMGQLTHRRPV